METMMQVDRDALIRGIVKGLEWHKSHMPSWNDGWHTVPTGYTIRCADEWGWKWSSPLGAFGHEPSPAAAQAAAEADYRARISAALDMDALVELVGASAKLSQTMADILTAGDVIRNLSALGRDSLWGEVNTVNAALARIGGRG